MSKQKTNIIPIVVIVLVLLVISGIIGTIFYVQQTALSCTGGSTYTITNADVKVNDLTSKQFIRLTAKVNGRGECARIIFDKATINNELASKGYAISQEKMLDLILKENKQTLYLRTNEQLVELLTTQFGGNILIPTQSNCKNKCETKSTTMGAKWAFTDGFGCYCVVPSLLGKSGDFEPNIKTSFIVEAKLEGYPTTIIDSDTIRTARIEDKVILNWDGNLVSTEKFLIPPNLDAFNSQGKYILVQEGLYNSLQTRASIFYTCVSNAGNKRDNVNTCVSIYNKGVAVDTVDKISELQSNSMVKSLSIVDNKVIVILNQPNEFPTFTIDIDAQFVGIQKVSGLPQVTCPISQEIDSSTTKEVSLGMKNIGKFNGAFDLGLECNKVTQLLSNNRVSLSSQSSDSVKGTISGYAKDEKVTNACTFKAVDINSGISDACTFNLIINPVKLECKDGVKICSDADTLSLCKAGNYIDENCKFGCKFGTDGAFCREDSCSSDAECGADETCTQGACVKRGTVCSWYDLKCQLSKMFAGYFTVGIILFSVLFGLIIFAIMLGIFKKMVIGSPTDMILSIIFGIATGFLFYYYIWFAIGVFIISLLVWMLLPSFIKKKIREGME